MYVVEPLWCCLRAIDVCSFHAKFCGKLRGRTSVKEEASVQGAWGAHACIAGVGGRAYHVCSQMKTDVFDFLEGDVFHDAR